MSNTFELMKEYEALSDLINTVEFDLETGEIIDNSIALEALSEELKGSTLEKLDSFEYIRKDLDSKVNLLSNEIKRMQQRKKAFENRSIRLKQLMQDLMVTSGETKLKGKHNFSLGSRKVLQISENLTPEFFNQEYVRTSKEFNKKKITQDLKEGKEIEGAEMIEKINFSIR